MAKAPTDFARHLSGYFLSYLAGSKNLSENTIASRRTTFSLLMEYCAAVEGIPAARLTIADVDRPLVERFLAWLEANRGNSASTCNVRLDAVKTFFDYLQAVAPEHLLQCQQVISIPRKREPKPCVRWLALEEVRAMLHAIDSSTYQGLRDLALISLLYDSAARVSELADARVRDLRIEAPPRIRLVGKGSKERFVPLMEETAHVMREYLRRRGDRRPFSADDHLFVNRSGSGLTRGGVSHILQRRWESVPPGQRDMGGSKITPHTLRHSRAVHLLQADVPLIYIRDFLGHAGLATTEIYAQCDSRAVREAVERSNGIAIDVEQPVWERDSSLLRWLESLSG